MALKRSLLKSMGLNDEQISAIMEGHTETVDGLKAEIEKYKADAEKLPGVQKELDTLKEKGDGGWEKKYNDEHAAFEKYKGEQSQKEAKAAKEKAVRAYYEEKGIKGNNLTVAMRGSSAEIAALEMDGDKIKDTKALDDLIAGDYAGLVTKSKVTKAKIDNPPGGGGGGGGMTKDEIAKIKDPSERRAAIANNIGLFEAKGEE